MPLCHLSCSTRHVTFQPKCCSKSTSMAYSRMHAYVAGSACGIRRLTQLQHPGTTVLAARFTLARTSASGIVGSTLNVASDRPCTDPATGKAMGTVSAAEQAAPSVPAPAPPLYLVDSYARNCTAMVLACKPLKPVKGSKAAKWSVELSQSSVLYPEGGEESHVKPAAVPEKTSTMKVPSLTSSRLDDFDCSVLQAVSPRTTAG